MKSKRYIWFGIIVLLIVVILIATAVFAPESANPAFAAAVSFVMAAGEGRDEQALALLDENLQVYVRQQCPDGSAAACMKSYAPPEWGAFRSVVFRRAAPDGRAWDVELMATYEAQKGASGICIYNRVEQNDAEEWRVTAWAGFVHCGEAASRDMATNPDTPHRAP